VLQAIRRYWAEKWALQPGYRHSARFRTEGAGVSSSGCATGVPGLVNLFGIESPGLTASLAIGEHVRALLKDA
jgi:L-2-hydroxyglutarate oxidase LhgO